MARGLASARDALHKLQLAIFGPDREDDQRVFPAITGVEEEPICRDGEFGRSVFVGGKIGRYRLDRGVGVDEKALRSVGKMRGSPEIVVEGRVDLVDPVDPAAIWVDEDRKSTRLSSSHVSPA